MKHVGLFKAFLSDVVDLNSNRLSLLDDSVEAIKTFLRGSDWEPTLKGFQSQGSWAHKTIIMPIAGGAFDADILACVGEVEGWEAKDYINTLRAVFKGSATYTDKVISSSHCITITYAGERKIDVAPLVVNREWVGTTEVCNRLSNEFEASAPKAYTDWFNQQNGYSGSNSFRKVTRLLKYLRGIKKTFKCPSVLLTTLLGDRIWWADKGTLAFEDTPSALQTVLGRLDDHLQQNEAKPEVPNPSMPNENFADLLTDDEYANFRTFVHKYRGWVDEAVAEEDFAKSISAWQRIFGEEFGKDAVSKTTASLEEAQSTVSALLSSTATHADNLVTAVMNFGTQVLPGWFYRPPYLHQPTWERANDESVEVYITANYQAYRKASESRPIESGDTLPPHGGIWLEARIWGGGPMGDAYRVEWRVTNTGALALSKQAGRGDFYSPSTGNRRWEDLAYHGVHFVEAFVIRRTDERLVGKSRPFDVVIM